MYKKILVAVDGSKTSMRALREAATLAKDFGCGLRIVHVVDLVSPITDYPHDVTALQESLRKAGNGVLAKAEAAARKAGVPSETRLLEVSQWQGRIAEEIARDAKKWRADLLVIGTHGRRGFSHLLLGSVAESLVRIATVPVLLIRVK